MEKAQFGIGIRTYRLLKSIPGFVCLTESILVCGGMLRHALTGTNSPRSYQALIRLFCITGGRSNDLLAKWVGFFHSAPKLGTVQGVLGDLTPKQINEIVRDLDQKGYHVFKNGLPEEVCKKILEYGSTVPAQVRGRDRNLVFSSGQPEGVRYDFPASKLANEPIYQSLMADPSILAVAGGYLRAMPILDLVSLWWHTAFQKEPDSDAAQFYHFDMDRIRWLKFFFYITDVTTESGPHCFIEESHSSGSIPAEILAKGYSRLEDLELLEHFSKEQFIEFVGKRGTIIAEDTRGLHKGKAVEAGSRLIFQLQFSNSLFGASYPKIRIQNLEDPRLKELIRHQSRIVSNIV